MCKILALFLTAARFRDPAFALQVFSLLRFAAYFFVSVLLVKFQISTSEIGSYEYALFLTSIVTGWWIDGLIQSYMAEHVSDGSFRNTGLLRKYSQWFLALAAGISLVFYVAGIPLQRWNILTGIPSGFFCFLIFHLLLQAAVLLVYHFYRSGRSFPIYILGVYIFLAYTGSFLLWISQESPISGFYFYLLLTALPLLFSWLYFWWKDPAGPPSQPGTIGRGRGISQLVIIQGIGFLSLWSDGFWAQYFYGAEETFAVFRYGAREFPLFVVLTAAFSTAMISWKSEPEGLRRIKKGSRRFIVNFSWGVILMLCVSQWLFEAVYDERFVPASVIFDMYLLLILVRVIFIRSLLMAEKMFGTLTGIAVAELFMNIFLSYTLYWSLGLVGLVLGTLLAHAGELILYLYFMKNKLKIPLSEILPLRLYGWFAGTVLFVFVIKYGFFSGQLLGLIR